MVAVLAAMVASIILALDQLAVVVAPVDILALEVLVVVHLTHLLLDNQETVAVEQVAIKAMVVAV
jgi:hypothetical protein